MDSRVILAKNIKLDKNYINVLDYNEQKMVDLCLNNVVAQSNTYNFNKQTGEIMVNFSYDLCLQANYIAFQNPNYSNKWFFAFIDKIEFINPGTTQIMYTVDSWSTWHDRWSAQTCFVKREHVSNDSIGLHTVNENLAVEEVVEEASQEEESLERYWICVMSSWNIYKQKQFAGASVYNKNVFGNEIYLIRGNTESGKNLGLFLLRTNGDGHIADVSDVFIIPDAAVDESKLIERETLSVKDAESSEKFIYYEVPYSFDASVFNIAIDKQLSFSDYTPKNNKCYVYPYNYLIVTNNNGNMNVFKYENFNTDKANFAIATAVSCGGSGRCIPLNYKNININDDESVPIPKYPTCRMVCRQLC